MNLLSIPATIRDKLLASFLGLPWLDMIAQAWQLVRKLSRGLADEGMYEVLEYESCLELKDRKGHKDQFTKREKVRYLQNNIIAYQDHAWGDGKILQNYQCTPGVVVDQYRPGQKTFLLISLREVKEHGDVDEFHIDWEIEKGFTRNHELWETDVRHRTQYMKVQVIFPKARPPRRVWLEEVLSRRKWNLVDDMKIELPDGRFQITWQTNQPRLNERYQLHWEW